MCLKVVELFSACGHDFISQEPAILCSGMRRAQDEHRFAEQRLLAQPKRRGTCFPNRTQIPRPPVCSVSRSLSFRMGFCQRCVDYYWPYNMQSPKAVLNYWAFKNARGWAHPVDNLADVPLDAIFGRATAYVEDSRLPRCEILALGEAMKRWAPEKTANLIGAAGPSMSLFLEQLRNATLVWAEGNGSRSNTETDLAQRVKQVDDAALAALEGRTPKIVHVQGDQAMILEELMRLRQGADDEEEPPAVPPKDEGQSSRQPRRDMGRDGSLQQHHRKQGNPSRLSSGQRLGPSNPSTVATFEPADLNTSSFYLEISPSEHVGVRMNEDMEIEGQETMLSARQDPKGKGKGKAKEERQVSPPMDQNSPSAHDFFAIEDQVKRDLVEEAEAIKVGDEENRRDYTPMCQHSPAADEFFAIVQIKREFAEKVKDIKGKGKEERQGSTSVCQPSPSAHEFFTIDQVRRDLTEKAADIKGKGKEERQVPTPICQASPAAYDFFALEDLAKQEFIERAEAISKATAIAAEEEHALACARLKLESERVARIVDVELQHPRPGHRTQAPVQGQGIAARLPRSTQGVLSRSVRSTLLGMTDAEVEKAFDNERMAQTATDISSIEDYNMGAAQAGTVNVTDTNIVDNGAFLDSSQSSGPDSPPVINTSVP
jgi:hypothetical protein